MRPAALSLGLVFALSACGGGSGPAAGKFPAWEGHGRELFGDFVDPSALGLETGKSDPALAERARQSELVARVRVTTVSSEGLMDGDRRYTIALQVVPPPLATPKLPGEVVEIRVGATSPAYGLVRQLDTALQGRTFVGFFYRFAGAEGEAVTHFHLATDSEAVVAAVKQAVILGELR
jgi:hypothetical protein